MAINHGKLTCILESCVTEKADLQAKIEQLTADKRRMSEEITTLVKAALKDQRYRLALQAEIIGLREGIEEFKRRCKS